MVKAESLDSCCIAVRCFASLQNSLVGIESQLIFIEGLFYGKSYG